MKLYIGKDTKDEYECYKSFEDIKELPRASYDVILLENCIGNSNVEEKLDLAVSKLAPEGEIYVKDVESLQVMSDTAKGFLNITEAEELLNKGSMSDSMIVGPYFIAKFKTQNFSIQNRQFSIKASR